MSHLLTRVTGHVGHITLQRPASLNALTHEMCQQIEASLDDWLKDCAVRVIIIDARGKSFCAGGDISEMYRTGQAGDFAYGRQYWRDEYRLNAKLANCVKPIVSFLQGYTMGGGVGLGCHVSHRIVGESSRVAMPECAIGLVPDVGGSLLLARSPGRLGEYLGMTGSRMHAADAILAGFADYHVPMDRWDSLKAELVQTGCVAAIEHYGLETPRSTLARNQSQIDHHFSAGTPAAIAASLADSGTPFATCSLELMARNSPLSMACTCHIVRHQRQAESIEDALDVEYRFTYRSAEDGEFLEGIRARIMERGTQPRWMHASIGEVRRDEIDRFLEPLGELALNWDIDQ